MCVRECDVSRLGCTSVALRLCLVLIPLLLLVLPASCCCRIMMYELYACRRPYSGMAKDTIAKRWAARGSLHLDGVTI